MDKIFLFFSSVVVPFFGRLFDSGRDIIKSFIDFFLNNFNLFIKWGLFLIVINLFFTVLSFFIYSVYYGGAYVLSQFVTQTTLNIIHMGFLGSVIYFIYKFMYKENP